MLDRPDQRRRTSSSPVCTLIPQSGINLESTTSVAHSAFKDCAGFETSLVPRPRRYQSLLRKKLSTLELGHGIWLIVVEASCPEQ